VLSGPLCSIEMTLSWNARGNAPRSSNVAEEASQHGHKRARNLMYSSTEMTSAPGAVPGLLRRSAARTSSSDTAAAPSTTARPVARVGGLAAPERPAALAWLPQVGFRLHLPLTQMQRAV